MFKRFSSKTERVEDAQAQEATIEAPTAPSPPKPVLKSALKEAVGTFVYNKMPEHEKARFESALSIQKRTSIHAGNAYEYEEYNSHVASQLEAMESEEERKFAEMEAQKKKRLMSQTSVIRRVNMACADEGTWRKNQGRASMKVSLKLPELGQGSIAVRNGGPGHKLRYDLTSGADEEDWLSAHTQQAGGPARNNNAARGSMRWVGANASQRGSIRMMLPPGQHTQLQQQQQADESGWMAKTRNFMHGVMGKLAGPEPTPPPMPRPPSMGRRSASSILSRLSADPSVSGPQSPSDTVDSPADAEVMLKRTVSRSSVSAFAACPDPRQIPSSATPEPWLSKKSVDAAFEGSSSQRRAVTSMGAEGGWRQFLSRSRMNSVCEPSSPLPGMSSSGGAALDIKLPSINLKHAMSAHV